MSRSDAPSPSPPPPLPPPPPPVSPCPLSPVGAEARMRAPLGRAAVFAALLTLSTCLTGSQVCPRSLDCARAGRHFCQPGSSQCGPCLYPLVETSRGRCVVKRRLGPQPAQTTRGKVSRFPELDEEIDLLSAVISEQRTITKAALQTPSGPEPSGPEPSPAAPTELPQSHSLAPPTRLPNATSDLLGEPVVLADAPDDHVFVVISTVFIVTALVALALAGACWFRLQRGMRLTQKMQEPLYGLMRAQTFDALPGDKRLAHSAQMFHYQHQKQQMLSMEKNEPKVPDSGASTDEENEDGDFTVYECPGLAPTGEMEVKNPLFDDSTLYLQRFHQ